MHQKRMKAYRIDALGKPPVLDEVAIPEPGHGEVLIRMGDAVLCSCFRLCGY